MNWQHKVVREGQGGLVFSPPTVKPHAAHLERVALLTRVHKPHCQLSKQAPAQALTTTCRAWRVQVVRACAHAEGGGWEKGVSERNRQGSVS